MDYTFSIVNKGVYISKYTGDQKEVLVPSEINGFPVVSIGDFAFEQNMRRSEERRVGK